MTTNSNIIEQAYILYKESLKRKAYFYLKDFGLAEDAVHNTMEKTIKYISKTNINLNLRGLLYTILKYECFTHMKRNKKVLYYQEENLNFFAENETDTTDNMDLHNQLEILENNEKALVVYRYFYGYNNKEIANIVNLTPNAVSRKINSSLRLLRQNFFNKNI